MAEPHSDARMKQVLDWRAAITAGIVASIVFLVVMAILDHVVLGRAFFTPRLAATIPFGHAALDPPLTFHTTYVPVGIIAHLLIGIVLACLIAFVVHPFGLLAGIVGGALLGLCFYVINFWSVSTFFPWMFSLKTWQMLVGHLIFGAVAGGVYESLERARYTRS